MKCIPSSSGRYAADVDGSIYSLVSGRCKKLTPTKFGDGYLRVSIYDESGGKKCKAVHRLVAETYLDRDPLRLFINHKNGIKCDNQLLNLEWVTKAENSRHAVNTGLHRAGSSVDMSLVEKARNLRTAGKTYASISLEIGRAISTVHSYVAPEKQTRPLPASAIFSDSDRAIMTDEIQSAKEKIGDK